MKRFFLIIVMIILGISTITAQTFTVGDLRYSINEDGVSVTLTGHVNGISGELNIPETVTYDDYDYSVTTIGEEAFWGCSGLTGSLVIPQSVSRIGESAFMWCTGFDGNLVLPESLAYIENYVFGRCDSLTGPLNLPKALTHIGDCAFYLCNFTGPLIIPDSVNFIGKGAFGECYGFSGELVIGKSVARIESNAFGYCNGITEVIALPETAPDVEYNTFNLFNCTTITVPCGCTSAYEHSYWSEHFTTIHEDCNGFGSEVPEWYYEIADGSGSVAYQYLSYESDTIIQDKKVNIIEDTNDYIYCENNKIYWWNKTLEEFTVLYDFGAQIGDYWEIKAGDNSIVVHVDMVGTTEYNGHIYKTMQISDYDDIFSGTIVCMVGHLTSFFPEKMLKRHYNYDVNGLRCFWNDGVLRYKEGDIDCDYIYDNHHLGVEEQADNNEFEVYPNPTNGIITIVGTWRSASTHGIEYTITNICGQTVMNGLISSDNQQINLGNLENGMYFIKIGDETVKIIKTR
ncbi:MAG: leucine-rich repeat domain-containing protein [Bacteroidales bacterium]|nr:leucine-rich repeat domain-containing protein [Bacteroidales bacterium]